MATEPLDSADKQKAEKLPVNVRALTDKRHAIVRLDQIQRGILKDPQLFERVDTDRSLNHVRDEVERLKEALTAYAQQQVDYEYAQLQYTLKLMVSWSAEEELSDVLTLDRSRYEEFQALLQQCEVYPDYVELLPRLQDERERLYYKYSGFFQNRAEELKRKREETQKKLKPCQAENGGVSPANGGFHFGSTTDQLLWTALHPSACGGNGCFSWPNFCRGCIRHLGRLVLGRVDGLHRFFEYCYALYRYLR